MNSLYVHLPYVPSSPTSPPPPPSSPSPSPFRPVALPGFPSPLCARCMHEEYILHRAESGRAKKSRDVNRDTGSSKMQSVGAFVSSGPPLPSSANRYSYCLLDTTITKLNLYIALLTGIALVFSSVFSPYTRRVCFLSTYNYFSNTK